MGAVEVPPEEGFQGMRDESHDEISKLLGVGGRQLSQRAFHGRNKRYLSRRDAGLKGGRKTRRRRGRCLFVTQIFFTRKLAINQVEKMK